MEMAVEWKSMAEPSLSGIMNTVVPVSAAVMMEMVAMSISTVAMSKPVTLKADDRKKLFLGANNKLYYPNDDVTINSFHAYLKLSNDYIAGDPDAGSNGVRSIVLDFGEGETTSIEVLKNGRKEELKLDGVWYDLSGRKVADSSRSSLLVPRSSKKSIYIVNGKKVVVK